MEKTTLKWILTLLVVMLSFAIVLTAFACSSDKNVTEDEKKENDFTSLVTNGDFETATTTNKTMPYSVSSWTGYTTSATNSSETVSGIINAGKNYDKAKEKWDSLANPYGTITDNNLLLIYNKTANVYGYTASFSTATAAYYTVSVKAKVASVEGGGATIRVSSDNGFSAFSDVTPTSDFTTYTFYIAAPRAATASVTVTLALGYSDKKVKGYAFFDEVVAKKITSSEYFAAESNTELTNTKFVSMTQPDGEFNNYNYASSKPYTPNGWATKDGKDAPTSYLTRGIVNTADESWDADKFGANPSVTAFAEGEDKNVLLVKAAAKPDGDTTAYTPSAAGYESSAKILVDLASLYELSVWVKCVVDEDESITDYSKKGAMVVLTGADTYKIANINTTSQPLNNGWAKVVFYIFGNQFRSKEFSIGLWIGDDENKDNFTQGIAYFDKLVLKKIQNVTEANRASLISEYNAKIENADKYQTYLKVVDLVSVNDNLVNNCNFETLDANGLPTGYEFKTVDNVRQKDGDVIVKVISKAELDAEEWTSEAKAKYGIDFNPSYPYALAPVLIVNNTIPTAYSMNMTDYVEIKQNLHYRLSVWIKTFGLGAEDNVSVKLVDKEGTAASSFSVNTKDYDNELTNDYAEYSFYIQGANADLADAATNSKFLRVEISYGSGTAYDPASYKKGGYLIANINMEQITYTEYNKASSDTYLNTKSFAENDATFTNANFNSYNLSKTEIDQDTGMVKYLDEFGNEGFYTGVLSDWTNNVDESYGTSEIDQKIDKDGNEDKVKVNNLIAGAINVNATAEYLAQFNLTKNDIFNNWASSSLDETKAKPVTFGSPNLLMITSRGAATISLADSSVTNTAAVKSTSISLSANSYYLMKCYAKVLNGAIGEIYLTTSSTDTYAPSYTVKNTDGWVEYVFVVNTGLSSVTAYFEIYYGQKGNTTATYSGTLLLDSFSYVSMTEDEFKEASEKDSTETAKFTTVTFDSSSAKDTAVKPSGFSGSGSSSSGYTNSDAQVTGVISENNFKYTDTDGKSTLGIYEEKKGTDESGNETTEKVIKEGSALSASEIFTSQGMEDGATVGNYLLIINNRDANYYTYQSSSLTLDSATYYQFSAYVRTAYLGADKKAKVVVTVDDQTYTIPVNTSTYAGDGKESLGGWKKVNFFIKNEKDSSVSGAYFKFTLGENTDDGKLQGYLFIDNVSMAKISEDEYNTLTALYSDYEKDENGNVKKDENGKEIQTAANKEFRLANSVIVLEKPAETDDNKDDENKTDDGDRKKLNTTLLWTYITSIAIAAVLIAVIVVWLVRKYRPKKGSSPIKGNVSYDRNAKKKDEEASESKSGTARDEFKD
ncbi:MAG: hypothetical protein K5753_00720 [Clostridia bacterium]|nr:hypothetical protein [Clostridia bacterium]